MKIPEQLLKEAEKLKEKSTVMSIPLIQRKLKVNYSMAAKLISLLVR